MASVILFTAARMQAIEDATVTSMLVNGSGHLIVTRKDASTFDAGDVSAWLPGRLKTINSVGAGNDPDALTDSGWYAGSTWAGSLTGYSVAILASFKYSVDWISQVLYVPAGVPRRLTRSRYNGTTWTAWVEHDVQASTSLRGEVFLASDAEAITGTDVNKAITPHALTSAIAMSSGIRGVITGIGAAGTIQVLLFDGVTTVSASVAPDAKQLASNSVLLNKYANGTYVITASQPQAGFISQPFDYINPKVAWYNGQTTDVQLYSPPWAYRSLSCWVSLTGMMRVSGPINPGDILVTLPPAFRPLQNKLVTALINGNSYLVLNIAPNGNLTLFQSTMAAGHWFTLDGIGFNNNPSLARTPMVLANGWLPYSTTDYTPQYIADDGYGRLIVEGMVKNTAATGSSGTPIALTSANPGLAEGSGVNGTLHRVAGINPGWERINLGYAGTGVNLSRESTAAGQTGLSLEVFMPTYAKWLTWTGVFYIGSSNLDYASNWRTVREGFYGDGMYGLTGLARINTGGTMAALRPGFAPKYTILQQPEASGIGNGRVDILAGENLPSARGNVLFVSGTGSYVGMEEYSWIPAQIDSALHW